MITVSIKIEYNHLPLISEEIRPIVSQVVRKTAFDIEGGVKDAMAAPKSGRIYRKGSLYSIKTRKAIAFRTHQASAPGEAPAIDYGQLANSIQVKNLSDYTSTVGTNIEYAFPLEFGSRKMKERPVWRPVAEKFRQPFIDAMTQLLQRLK